MSARKRDDRTIGQIIDATIATNQRVIETQDRVIAEYENVVGLFAQNTHVVRTRYVRPTGKVVNQTHRIIDIESMNRTEGESR